MVFWAANIKHHTLMQMWLGNVFLLEIVLELLLWSLNICKVFGFKFHFDLKFSFSNVLFAGLFISQGNRYLFWISIPLLPSSAFSCINWVHLLYTGDGRRLVVHSLTVLKWSYNIYQYIYIYISCSLFQTDAPLYDYKS